MWRRWRRLECWSPTRRRTCRPCGRWSATRIRAWTMCAWRAVAVSASAAARRRTSRRAASAASRRIPEVVFEILSEGEGGLRAEQLIERAQGARAVRRGRHRGGGAHRAAGGQPAPHRRGPPSPVRLQQADGRGGDAGARGRPERGRLRWSCRPRSPPRWASRWRMGARCWPRPGPPPPRARRWWMPALLATLKTTLKDARRAVARAAAQAPGRRWTWAPSRSPS